MPKSSLPRRRAAPLGLVRGLPIGVYHADRDAVSCSGLLDFARSPWHFFARHLHPEADRWRADETAGQLAGNLAHCLVLEPDAFASRYAVGPAARRNTNAWKAFEAECAEAGLKAIKSEEQELAQMQAASVRAHRIVAPLLDGGAHGGAAEVSAYAVDAQTGERVRVRPDYVAPIGDGNASILLDLKTVGVGMAKPSVFRWQVRRMSYDVQAALYSDFYALAASKPKVPHEVAAFVFVAVEDDWPFPCSAVILSDESMERGRARYRSLLDRYAVCRRENVWPGYSDDVALVSVPARYDEDDE